MSHRVAVRVTENMHGRDSTLGNCHVLDCCKGLGDGDDRGGMSKEKVTEDGEEAAFPEGVR